MTDKRQAAAMAPITDAPVIAASSESEMCREILRGFHAYLAMQVAPHGNTGLARVIGSDMWHQTCIRAETLCRRREIEALRRYLWAQGKELIKLAQNKVPGAAQGVKER